MNYVQHSNMLTAFYFVLTMFIVTKCISGYAVDKSRTDNNVQHTTSIVAISAPETAPKSSGNSNYSATARNGESSDIEIGKYLHLSSRFCLLFFFCLFRVGECVCVFVCLHSARAVMCSLHFEFAFNSGVLSLREFVGDELCADGREYVCVASETYNARKLLSQVTVCRFLLLFFIFVGNFFYRYG